MSGSGNCVHNKMIECSGDFRPCHKCGWNPEVHEKRVRKVVEAMKPKQKGLKI